MRRLAILSGILGLLAAGTPVQGHLGSHDVTFTTAMPCAVACPYWLNTTNTDLDGDGDDEIHFDVCAAPAPWTEGTAYDDVIIEPIPEGSNLVVFEIFPLVDSDMFVCELEDTWDGDGVPYEEFRHGGILEETCDNHLGNNNPVPVGCKRKAQINAKPGKQVVFRVYNWSDVPTVAGRYTFKDV